MQLSIIIVSYNVKYFLEQCLHTVRRASAGMQAEVIVVDNHSCDGSLDYLEPLFPEVTFIAAETNLGFSRACNLGYRNSCGTHILFLNPDVLLGEDSLHTCLRFLATHPEAGAVGVRMVDGSGHFLKESKRGFPAPFAALLKLSGLTALFPRSKVFSRYYLGHLSEHENHPVEVLAGAFMMIPRRVLDQVGLFDEAFFMYGEDIDLSYRIQNTGYRNYYLADTTIIHFKGESTRRATLQYVRVFYAAMCIFVRKHYRGSGAGIYSVLLQIAIGFRAALALAAKLIAWVPHMFKPQQPEKTKVPVAIYASKKAYPKIAAAFIRQGKATTRLKNLQEAALLERGQQLVLCLSRNSMSGYIQWLQLQQFSLKYSFYIPGSGSVVGSITSGKRGKVTILPNSKIMAKAGFGLVN